MPLKNKAISMHCLIFALNTQEGTSISSPALKIFNMYSKTCLKQTLKKKTKTWFTLLIII